MHSLQFYQLKPYSYYDSAIIVWSATMSYCSYQVQWRYYRYRLTIYLREEDRKGEGNVMGYRVDAQEPMSRILL